MKANTHIGDRPPMGNKLVNLMLLRDIVPVPLFMGITEYPIDLSGLKDYFSTRGVTNVSVRSAPAVSMPGMMDTVLNVNIQEIDEHVAAVFESINSRRAVAYMRNLGVTKPEVNVIVQEMVVVSDDSGGSGVAYTHNMQTANQELNGVFLSGVQGDRVVSNEQLCLSITEDFPHVSELNAQIRTIASLHRWPQEVEFTYRGKEISILQTRRCRLPLIPHLRLVARREQNLTSAELTEELGCLPVETLTLSGEPYLRGVGLAGGRVLVNTSRVLMKEFVSNEDIASITNYGAVVSTTGNLGSHPVTVCRNLGIPYVLVDNLFPLPPGEVAIDGYTGGFYLSGQSSKKLITHENYKQFI